MINEDSVESDTEDEASITNSENETDQSTESEIDFQPSRNVSIDDECVDSD